MKTLFVSENIQLFFTSRKAWNTQRISGKWLVGFNINQPAEICLRFCGIELFIQA